MSVPSTEALFKADLHCHSYYSGRSKHMRLIKARDCYSRPEDVYRVARRRGMDLVTITDHDSIGGCLELLDKRGELPDFIIGEEVTAYLPAYGYSIHIGVYGISEAQHREIQRLRGDADDLVAYLRKNDILFALNHLFLEFTRIDLSMEFLRHVMRLFRIFEVQNGAMQREQNQFVAQVVRSFERSPGQFSAVGGSDAHTLRRIGATYTASHARSREEFLADIRNARTFVRGRHADHLAIAADIYGVVLRYYPNVLQNRLREFGFFERVKNMIISSACVPFLFLPYLIAVRNAYQQRRQIRHLSRLFRRLGPSLAVPPSP